MQRMPRYNQLRKNRPIITRPRKPKLKKRFRWEIIVFPATALLLIWFLKGIEPAGTWEEFLDFIGIHDKGRFRRFMCLGLIVVCIVSIARILHDNKK